MLKNARILNILLSVKNLNTGFILQIELGSAKIYEHTLLNERSFVGICAIWLLSLMCLLMRIMISFLRNTGQKAI